MADVLITEYTDPACPWAYSAEPFRRRLTWLYGDALEWQFRMVVLAETAEDFGDRGITPARQAAAFARIARDHGMPIDTRERPRLAATAPACRAVVAARMHAAAAADTHLRRRAARRAGDDRGRCVRCRTRPGAARALERR